MAVKKPESKSKELMILEQQMLEDSKAGAARELLSAGLRHISTKGGMLSVDDKVIKSGQIEVVVLMGVHTNAYYEGNYNPDNPTPPVCYAFGTGDPDEVMRPHEAVKTPFDEGEGCDNCENNFYGTADNGVGKACKNGRKLLMITEDGFEGLEVAEVVALNVPPTSLKKWATYVQQLSTIHGRPIYGVQTLIKIEQDPKTQWVLNFELAGKISDPESYAVIKSRLNGLFERVSVPYPDIIATDKPKAKTKAVTKASTIGKPKVKAKAAPAPQKKVTKAAAKKPGKK